MKKILQFWFFHWISIKNKKFDRWFFQMIRLWVEKKRLITEKVTKFEYIFDTKDFILCVVYDEIVDKKSFEKLNIKFVILQTKEICQFLFNSKIVDNNKNARNETINIDENKSIVLNVQMLITRTRIRFSFNLKSIFSITRSKFCKKRSKNKSFKSKKSFEKSNNLFVSRLKNTRFFLNKFIK